MPCKSILIRWPDPHFHITSSLFRVFYGDFMWIGQSQVHASLCFVFWFICGQLVLYFLCFVLCLFISYPFQDHHVQLFSCVMFPTFFPQLSQFVSILRCSIQLIGLTWHQFSLISAPDLSVHCEMPLKTCSLLCILGVFEFLPEPPCFFFCLLLF